MNKQQADEIIEILASIRKAVRFYVTMTILGLILGALVAIDYLFRL